MVAPLASRPESADRAGGGRRARPAPRRHRGETEAGRRLAPDLVDDLRAAGCFRMMRARAATAVRSSTSSPPCACSRSWPGPTGRPAGLSGSAAPAGSTCATCRGPRSTPSTRTARLVTAGVDRPTGMATPTDGGYRVNGRWAFASGCEHADVAVRELHRHGEAAASGDGSGEGPPPMRVAVLAPQDVAIEDTWTVSGLCGTGSHHITVDDVVVPADRTYPLLDGRAVHRRADDPDPAAHAVRRARGERGPRHRPGRPRRRPGAGRRQDPVVRPGAARRRPVFQQPLATADARLRAARAVLRRTPGGCSHGRRPASRSPSSCGPASGRPATWATDTAAVVVDAAYRAGGGTSLYATSPLQRRLRDVHAVTQHFLVRPDTIVTAGAVLAGQDTDTSLL